MGVSISWIFVAFTGASIAQVFDPHLSLSAACRFGIYTTKRDISKGGFF
jgi:FtsH-binding integral membrane protein